jgi:hypothetical protein
MDNTTLVEIYQQQRKLHRQQNDKGLQNISDIVQTLNADLIEIKAKKASMLRTLEARQVLLASIEVLQKVVHTFTELNPHAWIKDLSTDSIHESTVDTQGKQILLLRILQGLVVLITLSIAFIDHSPLSLLLVGLLTITIVINLLIFIVYPNKIAKNQWLQNIVYKIIPQPLKWLFSKSIESNNNSPKFEAYAEILASEQEFSQIITEYLKALDNLLDKLDIFKPVNNHSQDEFQEYVLRFIQLLSSRLIRKDDERLLQAVEVEFPNLLERLNIETSIWLPNTPVDAWEVKKSPTITGPVTALPSLMRGNKVLLRGVVYHPTGGNHTNA